MQLDIDREVALLHRMTVGQLREKYQETWGEPTNTRNKHRRRHFRASQASRCRTCSRYRHPYDCAKSHKANAEAHGRYRDGFRPAG